MSSSQPSVAPSFKEAAPEPASPGSAGAERLLAAATPDVPRLEPIVLAARPGAPELPPVRIFLGTEPAQHRPERVFVYALEQVRNPDRRYEVYRMTGLAGFRQHKWRTGFTNYRFAIPALAGGLGRAIYNDVDQFYCADPAELFDQPMDGHGYLALTPRDTAVMLIDCARMLPLWSYAAAQQRGKKSLLDAAEAEPGLWGALDPDWHARDLEFRPGRSKLIHYTALDSQPWQPLPEQYTYQIHPHGERYLGLEQAADDAGYEIYTAQAPSPGFAAAATRPAAAAIAFPSGWQTLARELGVRSIGVIGALADAGPGLTLDPVPLAELRSAELPVFDAMAATDLDAVPAEDLPWIVDRMFADSRRLVCVHARARGDGSLAGTVEAWRRLLRRVAARYPGRVWQLDAEDASGRLQRWRADAPRSGTPARPTAWLLLGTHTGDNAQLIAIAEALGCDYESKQARFGRYEYRVNHWLGGRLSRRTVAGLAPPWPDLVISAGRRSAPVARWIKAQSGGRTRIVHVGRSRVPLSRFDLVFTTPQYGLPLADNVIGLPAPFVAPRTLGDAERARWAERFAELPRPWIAMLVGGNTKPYVFDAGTGAALGHAASAAARERGGSLLVSTSPRTPPAAVDALRGALEGPQWVYRFGSGDENPYGAFLALADGFIVTGDSATMLAEVCMTGRPVSVFPLRIHRSGKLAWRHRFERWFGVVERDASDRGTERQQGRAARLYQAGVAAGLVRRERRFEPVYAALGLELLPAGLDAPPAVPPDMLDAARARAVRAIRALLTAEHVVLP